MTNDKEERIITFDELRKQPGSIIERQEWWENLPLAPTHTDEDVERLLKHDMGLAKKLVTLQARIKELEADLITVVSMVSDEWVTGGSGLGFHNRKG